MENIQRLELLREFSSAWNDHDVYRLMRCMSDDCVFYASGGMQQSPKGAMYVGRENVKHAYEAIWTAIPDAQWRDAAHFVDNDRGFSEWTFTGPSADGAPIRVYGVDIFRFRGNKIAEKNTLRKNLIG
ncbi:MAG: nuclear transport factor 2 family protein [Pseudomonadota bacterium]